MNCPKREIKKFLWVGIAQPCVMIGDTVAIWGDPLWNKFSANFICKYCGARDFQFGLADVDLIKLRIDHLKPLRGLVAVDQFDPAKKTAKVCQAVRFPGEADCDFPFCDCDPSAQAAVNALDEMGLLRHRNYVSKPVGYIKEKDFTDFISNIFEDAPGHVDIWDSVPKDEWACVPVYTAVPRIKLPEGLLEKLRDTPEMDEFGVTVIVNQLALQTAIELLEGME